MSSVRGADERFHIRTFFGTQAALISRIIGSRSRHREHGLTNRMKRSSVIPVKDSCVMPAMYEMVWRIVWEVCMMSEVRLPEVFCPMPMI